MSAAVFAAMVLKPQTQPAADAGAALAHAVGPFLQKNCETCHNSSFPSGDIDLQQLLATPNSLVERLFTWQDVAFQLRSGHMPPPGAPRPSPKDAEAALAIISRAIAAAPARRGDAAPVLPLLRTTDWLTFSYDPERTGWDRGETKITKATAPRLHLLWKLKTPTQATPVNHYSTLTEALAVNDVPTAQGRKNLVYVGSRDNAIDAIDAEKGTLYWTRRFPNHETPPVASNGSCPGNMNATPVVDPQKGILYLLANDGKLRGISLRDGTDRFPPTQFVPAFSRNFSLNLANGWIATGTTLGCANAISSTDFIDVNDPAHPVMHFFTSPGKGSGPWGRGGIVSTPFGWVMQTADGAYDPAGGRWGNSVLSFTHAGVLVDSFTPPDERHIDARDLDLGSSSPVAFPFGDRTLIATAGKQGVIDLLDARDLGGADHRTALYTSRRWSNDGEVYRYNGMWSVMTTYLDHHGRRWLLAPFYGPPAHGTVSLFRKTHGPALNGELMAFTVEGTGAHPWLQPQWISADLDLPGVAVVANNVVLILANGDRAETLVAHPFRRPLAHRASPEPTGPPTLPLLEVNPAEPGYESDREWRSSQLRPFAEGGQRLAGRYQGGRQTTHAVLYALDAETGDEIYSSGDAIDSWNHYGGLAVSDGKIYVTSYDGHVFAFGVRPNN